MNQLIISAFLLFFCIPVSIAQDVYSRDVKIISKTDQTVTLSSSGIHKKKKEAIEMALKSAFYTLFFTGVDGLNNGDPLINKEVDTEAYLDNFYNGSKYTLFLGAYNENKKVQKLPTKDYRAFVTMEVMYDALRKDLIDNGLAKRPEKEVTIESVENEIAFPSITVVPFKKESENYSTVLNNDPDRRMAVNKVHDGFRERNIETYDFLASLNATLRSAEYEADGVASSNDKELLMSSGADVYVIVDVQKKTAQAGNSVSLSLNAYETATGGILATKQGWTPAYDTNHYDKLCVLAVKMLLDDFMKDISSSFVKKVSKGNSVALRVSLGENATILDFKDQVAGKGSFSSLIRKWVRKNSQNGKYHLKGITAEAIFFDKLQIPPKAADGFPMDAATFTDEFVVYLEEELMLTTEYNIEGNTIYITIF